MANFKATKYITLMQKFENQGHKIYHGDAIEVLSNEIEDNSVDLIFIDPPYNIGKKI